MSLPPGAAAPPPPPPPASALAWLRAQGVDVESLTTRQRRLPAPGRWVCSTETALVRVAQGPTARRWLALELARSRWARDHGIPTPAVLHHCDDVLVTERCATDPHAGRGFVRAAVRAASAVERAPAPPQVPGGEGGARPVVARSRVRALGRGLRHGVDWREFTALRRAAATLPRTVTVHGDFHGGNVLHDAGQDCLVVIDWEDAGPGARGHDLLTLWPRLGDEDDRGLLLDHVLTDSRDRAATGVLHRWNAVRYLADLCTSHVPPPPAVVAAARARVREARRLA